MAQASAFLEPLPPTPPPPVYSQSPYRSQNPQHPITTHSGQGIAPNDTIRSANPSSSIRPVARRSLSAGAGEFSNGVLLQSTRSGPVRLHTPRSQSIAESFAVSVQDHGSEIHDAAAYNRPALQAPMDRDRLSPAPSKVNVYRRSVLQERQQDGMESGHRRVSSENPQQLHTDLGPGFAVPNRHVSAPPLDSQSAENFQPLQYHHQLFEDDMQVLGKRTSKLTMGSNNADGPAYNDRLPRPDQNGQSDLRQSIYGRALQRPDSGFSSSSDLRGRTRSPQLSPNHHARAVSTNSRSPDVRPLSYVDLLNVPYPQPPPGGAENLINSQLRAAVGTNASLATTRQKLEMYRANVKKTTDPAIQYEFAVLLISAAQDANAEEEQASASGFSEQSSGSLQSDLLKEAKIILQRLADRSYPFAQYYLADGLASGLFSKGKEDYDRAFPLFLAASKHGHAEAGYRTALCYEFGWGCRVDAAKAVQFYQHAASKNHPGAMLRLARACLMGDMGLGKRYKEGIRWLKRAAESADFQYNAAPYELGILHETGYGDDVFADETYAAQLFTKSADLGHTEANYRLGDAYEHGKLTCPRDPALSVHFYTAAAEQGHPLAQMALCAWYMIGVELVLEKDETEAYEWARKAAESGFPKAEYTVGYFTEMGIGCRRDPLEANVWYVRAADHGDDRAQHRIAAIRAAATGANPVTAAKGKRGFLTSSNTAGNVGAVDSEKSKKRFGIF